MIRDEATERQVAAANPKASTWLMANAGSGKTSVLTNRVARLLIGGVPPQRILCLTYTIAAANEMQNRLFGRLGAWAMRDDRALTAELRELGVEGPLGSTRLAEARRLFARALETPGGLKIQTIHSFCAGLLRRFPLEAGVGPEFTELEESASVALRRLVLEEMVAGPERALVDALAAAHGGAEADPLLAAITARAQELSSPPSEAELARAHGIEPGTSLASTEEAVFQGGEGDVLRDLHRFLAEGSANDVKAAAKLAPLVARKAPPELGDLDILEDVFLTGAGATEPFSAKLGKFPTKATRGEMERAGCDLDALEAFMRRVEAARPARLGLAALERTRVLHAFAGAFLPRYTAAKAARGALDFDDLIHLARALLTDPAQAQWVLWRLDGGIEHILVDEAQDTSPAQWEVIRLLAEEIAAGLGAERRRERTLFVVGDPKQSIYSFQGADAEVFADTHEHFRARLAPPGPGLLELDLQVSFRSAPEILRAVDATFERAAGPGFSPVHKAHRHDMPGRVDLWEPVPPSDKDDPQDWRTPTDRTAQTHHSVVLARRIAARIGEMIAEETICVPKRDGPGWERRALHAGDFLVLVQRRSALFAEVIRACKALGLPVAGADRLKVGAELAVKDLLALLRFLALPEDCHALACALRSPLFGVTEAELYALAAGRGNLPLWAVIRDRGGPLHVRLAGLRDGADFLRPYELLETVLTAQGGRQALVARLGPEAEDGIDALLSQALAYEDRGVPSLTGFLSWVETENLEIKRQADAAGQRIRVMTVHGAKGLEAPVVILPDCAERKLSQPGALWPAAGTVLWPGNGEERPPALDAVKSRLDAAQEAERLRLLYVAMTRAQSWLIVAAAGKAEKACWHAHVRAGLEALGALPLPGGGGLRIEGPGWAGPASASGAAAPPAAPPPLPPWAHAPAAAPVPVPAPLSPSDLGGAKALPGEAEGWDEEEALRRGRQIHLLLETLPELPESAWPGVGRALLATGEEPATPAEMEERLEQAARVLRAPGLADLFGPGSMAEKPIAADLPGPGPGARRMLGVIDRLVVAPGKVLAADFKSNRLVPPSPEAVPEGLLRQMGAYRAALAQVFPGREIATALVFTQTAARIDLPAHLTMPALERALATAGAPAPG